MVSVNICRSSAAAAKTGFGAGPIAALQSFKAGSPVTLYQNSNAIDRSMWAAQLRQVHCRLPHRAAATTAEQGSHSDQ